MNLQKNCCAAYIRDSAAKNIEDRTGVGHRRWILNPPLSIIGAQEKNSLYDNLQVHDRSGDSESYDVTTFPCAGHMPLSYMTEDGINQLYRKDTAWSVSFNPQKHTLTENKDQLDVSVYELDKKFAIKKTMKMKHIEWSAGTGFPDAVTFSMDNISMTSDSRFLVVISGVNGDVYPYLVHFYQD